MELDLTQLVTWGKAIVAAVLALVAAIMAGPSIMSAIKARAASIDSKTVTTIVRDSSSVKVTEAYLQLNSDKLPPEGFTTHAKMIVDSSPYASPDIQLSYVLKGLTESQTTKAEVLRMGLLITPIPITKVPSVDVLKGVES